MGDINSNLNPGPKQGPKLDEITQEVRDAVAQAGDVLKKAGLRTIIVMATTFSHTQDQDRAPASFFIFGSSTDLASLVFEGGSRVLRMLKKEDPIGVRMVELETITRLMEQTEFERTGPEGCGGSC